VEATVSGLQTKNAARYLLAALGVIIILGIAALLLEPKVNFERRFFPGELSVELSDAPGGKTATARAFAWLKLHKSDITEGETRFRVDRRAIAGLIAYEGLLNVHLARYGKFANWSGPGKIHYKRYRFSEGNPVAKQVENLGLLPRRSVTERAFILQNAEWASLYIAAIMRELSNVVRSEAHHDVTCEPGALITLLVTWDIPRARTYFSSEDMGKHYALSYSEAGNWAVANLPEIEKAVGFPKFCLKHTPVQNDHASIRPLKNA